MLGKYMIAVIDFLLYIRISAEKIPCLEPETGIKVIPYLELEALMLQSDDAFQVYKTRLHT